MATDMDVCLSYVLDKIKNRNFGLEDEKFELRNLILETLDLGRSSFVLLIGQRGAGQEKMVEEILREIKVNKNYKDGFKIIKMNGYLQENDEIALKHLTCELNDELNEDDLTEDVTEDEDSTEESESPEENELVEKDLVGTVEDHFKHLITVLDEGNPNSMRLIFILDEFQEFCEKGKLFVHHLLDVINLEKVPMCIVGIGNKNCINDLTLRDKSRTVSNVMVLKSEVQLQKRLDQFRSLFTLDREAELPTSFKDKWNKNLNQLLSNSKVTDIFKEAIGDASEEEFSSFMNNCIVEWFCETQWEKASKANEVLSVKHIVDVFERKNNPFNIGTLIQGLKIIQLCLLIAICHVPGDTASKSFNFITVYEKFKSFTNKFMKLHVSRCVAWNAFYTLERDGFIKPEDSAESDELMDYTDHHLQVDEKLVLDVIRNAPCATPEMREWISNPVLC